MPTAGPGVTAGTILAFARALGEYGATSMLAGNIPGKTGTISQKIAMVIQDGDYLTAGVWDGDRVWNDLHVESCAWKTDETYQEVVVWR